MGAAAPEVGASSAFSLQPGSDELCTAIHRLDTALQASRCNHPNIIIFACILLASTMIILCKSNEHTCYESSVSIVRSDVYPSMRDEMMDET